MKKNWVVFILVVIVAYGFLFYDQIKKEKAFQEAQAKYLVEWEEYVQVRDAMEADRQARLAEMARTRAPQAQQQTTTDDGTTTRTIASGPTISEAPPESLISVETAPRHTVETPLYTVVFSELGGRPLSWRIKSSEYVRNVGLNLDELTTTTVELIPQAGDPLMREYPLEFTGATARDFNDILYDAEVRRIDGGTRVTFTSLPLHDMVAVKEFVLRDDSYIVDAKFTFRNGSQTRKTLGRERGFGIGWQGGFEDSAVHDRVQGYQTALLATDDDLLTRTVSRDGSAIDIRSGVHWAGIEKKFFATLLIPAPDNRISQATVLYNPKNDAAMYQVKGAEVPISVELYHPRKELELRESHSLAYQIYAGPKNLETLKPENFVLADDMMPPSKIVFHYIPLGMGWLRSICLLLLGLLKWLHATIGSWGLAVIGTTIIVRLLVYPLTHWAIRNQARTMIEQKKIRPELEKIQKKFKGDPMKRNQEMMKLYREHNVNPLGFMRGCFPILLQMPVFLGLYVVFDQSVELRGQSFLWIDDLSAPDRFISWGVHIPLIGDSLHLLPILMAVTNYLQMKIMHTQAADEMQERIQKQMMIMMPVMFVFFLYNLPSGLILYWVVSNIWGIAQSYLTKRYVAAHERSSGPPSGTLAPAAT